MIFLQIPEMDMSNKTPILLLLIICINSASGQDVPRPEDLAVNVSDGDVIVHWKHPAGAPSNSTYNVQMGKYNGEWKEVKSCTGTTNHYCDLSRFILDYYIHYKVKVQLVTGHDKSEWISKRIRPNESKLQPPSFTLLATSSTLSVSVHKKPILRKLFPFGLTYTIYLEDRGQDNKTTTAYLKDDVGLDQTTKTFSSLHWGREYCVSMVVAGNAALSISALSPTQCLQLPEQEWYIIAISSLSILGVLTIVAISVAILLCYLKRPEKIPAVLKSPSSYWLPLSVGEGTIEVVTDRGWFLSSYRTEVKNCVKDPVTHVTVIEDNEEEERRTSMDSGVSMGSSSAIKNEGSPVMKQDDSGCGSLGGPESSTSSQTDYPMPDERTDTDTVGKREDSGLGLGCQLHSSSMNLDGQDNGILKESVLGGNYRTQSPSAVQIHVCNDEEGLNQVLPDTDLAEVVTGYKAGIQSCICSGAGQCTWCHKQGHYGSEVIRQYRAMCIENGSLSSKCDFVDSYKASYSKKSQMNSVIMDDFKNTFTKLGESFPLLTTLVEGEHDFNMNNVSLSLCDVQLTTD
ncbi:interleukin-10 receptor subunit alpha isoform X1 [Seriola aureovittata]|uniref:interleukin-10 receptor subunit alpha isoform X1 n=2 Tax=Seriola aureovittata TaxID=2871759 RepID=UPI0024BE235E|nr:interleukin-10 receptor subunit alpha isoform X1 [Seriola aureovittata]